MLLDIDLDRLREGFWSYLPLGSVIALVVVAEMVLALLSAKYGEVPESEVPPLDAAFSNVQAVGRLLFTEYVYPFELASVVLLVGIVAAVALTFRGKRGGKLVDPSEQVFVKSEGRVRLVRMPAEKDD